MRVLAAFFLAVFFLADARTGDAALVRRFVGLTDHEGATRFARCGILRINVGADGLVFSGQLRLGPHSFALAGVFDESGNARFGNAETAVRVLVRPRQWPAELACARVLGVDGLPRIVGTVIEQPGDFVTNLEAAPAIYVAAENPPAPLLQTPAELLGLYTIMLPPTSPERLALARSEYPQGSGVGVLRVRASGRITTAGRLADGSILSSGGSLCAGQTWPLWDRLYGGMGGILGMAQLRETLEVSDADALGCTWFKPANRASLRYPEGWPGGIKVDVLGSKYVGPAGGGRRSVFPGLSAPGAQGNARFRLQHGGLADADVRDIDPHTPLLRSANIDAGNRVRVLPPGVEKFSSTLNPANGMITGTFRHNRTHTSASYRAVIFQKQARAFGFFISPPMHAP